MTKKPFQEQLSKFSLLGELPKVETGLEEAWDNLKKCTEPFTAQDIIRQQRETINRLKSENERLQKENEILSTNADNAFQEGLNESRELFKQEVEAAIRAEARKEFIERLKQRCVLRCFDPMLGSKIIFSEDDIDNLEKELEGAEDA